MAGKGRKLWTRETLSSADVQDYLQDQVVLRFASAAARQGVLPNPTEGMVSTLDDTETVERYNGAAWVPIGLFAPAGAGSLAGASVVPAGGRPLIVQEFSRVVSTNVNGDTTVPFPTPFPGGLLNLQATSGDALAGNHAKCAPNSGGYALGSVSLKHWQPNGAVCSSVNVRVNVRAVGW